MSTSIAPSYFFLLGHQTRIPTSPCDLISVLSGKAGGVHRQSLSSLYLVVAMF